jgi:hypothetical protein
MSELREINQAVRFTAEEHALLKRIADIETEGNVSQVIRKLLDFPKLRRNHGQRH